MATTTQATQTRTRVAFEKIDGRTRTGLLIDLGGARRRFISTTDFRRIYESNDAGCTWTATGFGR